MTRFLILLWSGCQISHFLIRHRHTHTQTDRHIYAYTLIYICICTYTHKHPHIYIYIPPQNMWVSGAICNLQSSTSLWKLINQLFLLILWIIVFYLSYFSTLPYYWHGQSMVFSASITTDTSLLPLIPSLSLRKLSNIQLHKIWLILRSCLPFFSLLLAIYFYLLTLSIITIILNGMSRQIQSIISV